MLAVSSQIADGQEVRELTDADRRALLRQSEEFNAEAIGC